MFLLSGYAVWLLVDERVKTSVLELTFNKVRCPCCCYNKFLINKFEWVINLKFFSHVKDDTKNKSRTAFLRQLGYLLRSLRPVAFRTCLTAGLAFSYIILIEP